MGLFDGGMFDIDGDGKTTKDEEGAAILALAMMKKMEDDKQLESTQHQPRRTAPVPTPKTKEGSPAPAAPQTEEAKKQPVSADEYRRTRGALIELTLGGLALALTLCVLPALFIWAAITTHTPGNSSSNFVSMLFIAAGMGIIIFIFYIYINVIKGQWASFRKLREQYRDSLSDQELKTRKKEHHRNLWLLLGMVFAVTAAVVIGISVDIARKAEAYHDAETRIAQEDYAGASLLLQQMEPSYRDVSALLKLCKAHEQFSSDRTVDAYYTLESASFRYQSPEQTERIKAFQELLQKKYNAEMEAQAKWEQEEYERIQALPFPTVGQYVTSAQYEHMSYQRGDSHTCSETTTVYYYVNGDDAYYVWVSQNDQVLHFNEVTIKGSTKTNGKSGKGSTYSYDPEVDDFTNPEDFYDWYKDDFIDYDEAEEYYYEHGGD